MNKGQSSILNVMLAVVIIILMFSLAGPLKFFIEVERNTTSNPSDGLGCVLSNGTVNGTLNNFQQGSCYISDLTLPFFIWAGLGIGGAVLVAKIVLG